MVKAAFVEIVAGVHSLVTEAFVFVNGLYVEQLKVSFSLHLSFFTLASLLSLHSFVFLRFSMIIF